MVKNKDESAFGCGDPQCEACRDKLPHPLTQQMNRVQLLAANFSSGVIAGTKHMMQLEHKTQRFENRTMAYIELHLQLARCHFAEVMVQLAQQETLTRKEMREMLKAMHTDFTDWFEGAINDELAKIADHYDQMRSESATKQ